MHLFMTMVSPVPLLRGSTRQRSKYPPTRRCHSRALMDTNLTLLSRSYFFLRCLCSLQCHQRHIILLLPGFSGKAFQFVQQVVDERCPISVLCEQYLQAREAEHLTPGIMRLHQAITIEQDIFTRG